MDIFLAFLGAGTGGGLVAIGAAANARLRQTIHSPIAAAAINFWVGWLTLTLLIVSGCFPMPPLAGLANVPVWALGGGLLGAAFVSLGTVVIPRLGLTTTTLAVVLSQMLVSLIVDQQGWFGVAPHPLRATRVIAIGLLVLAIALNQVDRPSAGRAKNAAMTLR